MACKGIIMAGGNGTRLHPITKAISKQLLPVYDKPMIYYPISTLMLAGIREFLIITTPKDLEGFKLLLGEGECWGISIKYEVQKEANGLVEGIIIGENFINDEPIALILGDNLFHGEGLMEDLQRKAFEVKGATILAYPVSDPERYGVVNFTKDGKVAGIEEKPSNPKSNYAITGLYFYDKSVVAKAKKVIPSERGELEISDLNRMYLENNDLKVELMGRGMAWLDTGTYDSLHEASSYIRTLERRQGLKVGCPEEIAWRQGWISNKELEKLALPLRKSGYGDYLLQILNRNKH